MADNFYSAALPPHPGFASPFVKHIAVTPDDDNDLALLARSVRCNGAGDVVLTDQDGTDITYTVAAGEVIPGFIARVKATGTTATGIVAWI